MPLPCYSTASNWIFRQERSIAAFKVNRGRLVDGVVVRDAKDILFVALQCLFKYLGEQKESKLIVRLACTATKFRLKAKSDTNYLQALLAKPEPPAEDPDVETLVRDLAGSFEDAGLPELPLTCVATHQLEAMFKLVDAKQAFEPQLFAGSYFNTATP